MVDVVAAPVEAVLDACHALMSHGVDRYKRPYPLSLQEEKRRQVEREAALQQQAERAVRHELPRDPEGQRFDVTGGLRGLQRRDHVRRRIHERAIEIEDCARDIHFLHLCVPSMGAVQKGFKSPVYRMK